METASTLSVSSIVSDDQQHVWHPYTQAETAPIPREITHAQGAKLYAEDGSIYIDAISSWWVTLFGHGHPYIADAIAKQAKTLEHVMFADFTHAPAVKLAKSLLEILPSNLSRIFYSDNGSTAVETALKIAFQYHYIKNPEQPRHKVVVLEGGFHGETVGAMSLSDRGLFSAPFAPLLFDVITIPAPTPGSGSLEKLEEILENEPVACFMFEPLVQAVSSMRFHDANGLSECIALCQAHDVLCIADEVMTGFGRLGPLFASDELSHKPDMICLAKPMTGGFLPLAATACTEKIYEQFLSDDRRKALLHGHSYCANPLGCAAALATLDLLRTPVCERQRASIEEQHLAFLEQIKHHPMVQTCRVKGTLLVVEYKDNTQSYHSALRNKLSTFFLDRGVLIRPFGNSIHVLPPYCISEAELEEVYRCIADSLEELS